MGIFGFLKSKNNGSLADYSDETIRLEANRRGDRLTKVISPQAASMRQQTIQSWKTTLQAAKNPENPNRIQLYDVIDSMMLDAHLSSIIESRTLPLQHAKHAIYDRKTGDEDPELNELFETEWFDDYKKYWLENKFFGTTVAELFDTNEEGRLKNIAIVPRRHVKPEKGIIVKEPGDETGWNYKNPPFSNYYIQFGKDTDLGLLIELAPIVIAKKFVIAAWNDYVEKYGIPPRWVTSSSISATRLKQLETMMKNMISSAWAVLEGDEKIESMQLNGREAYQTFKELISLLNSEMSKKILGQDGTTDNKDASGTYGSLKVLEGVAEDRHKADKSGFKYHVNEVLIPFLVSRGYPLEGKQFDWDEFNELGPKDLIEAVSKLSNHFEVDHEYITEKTGIPIFGRNPNKPIGVAFGENEVKKKA